MEQINWMEWGKEAFERAKKENKPILLDIGAVWCHWCYQMEKNTYSDPIVIKTINENFIPIKVDTDKRPDINDRYNQGGWPTTAFLTPDGELIAGATYVAPEHMKTLLPQVKHFYGMQGGKIKGAVKKHEHKEGGISEQIIQEITGQLKENFDQENGGFYYEPKFPMTEALELAMLEYKKTGESRLLEMITKTLDSMTGIYDKEEGGFFRYSVTQDWSVPHYEKMLEVNAGLLQNYIHGFALTGRAEYRKTAEGIVNYIRQKLKGAAFYGSQDADEEYYALPLEQRQERQEPFIDKTIYTNWNAKCIIAFIDAYAVLGDDSCLRDAEQAMSFLIDKCYDPKQGMCHYHEGKRKIFGLLADNAWAMAALLRLHQATGKEKYLEHAEAIASYMTKSLKDGNGFFDRTGDESLGMLKEKNKPIMDNSIAAIGFIELAALTGKDEHMKTAKGCLSIFAEAYKTYGPHSALYALAVEKFLDGAHIIVVGDENDRREIRKLLAIPDPRTTLQFLEEEKDKKQIKKLGYGKGVFMCRGTTCNMFGTIEEAAKKLGGLG